MNVDYVSIGTRIKYIRTQKGLSQEELAEFADVSPVYISNIERGEKSASLKTVIAVANALNVTADSLLIDNLVSLENSRNEQAFDILGDCTKEENDIIIKSMKALKKILQGYSVTK